MSDSAPAGPIVAPVGDDHLLVDLREPVSIVAARRARLLAAAIRARCADGDPEMAAATGAGDPVAAAASVLVPLAPGGPGAGTAEIERLEAALLAIARDLPPDPPPSPGAREHVLAVRYGGDAGPDLAGVAEAAGLHAADVISLHAGTSFEVLFMGFAPGFGYLGELPERLHLPRLATPRVRVPAGSVAIAGAMTAVYPADSPGGWRLLGATDARLLDLAAPEPALLRAGDLVRFRPA